jgi:hypothetical protein
MASSENKGSVGTGSALIDALIALAKALLERGAKFVLQGTRGNGSLNLICGGAVVSPGNGVYYYKSGEHVAKFPATKTGVKVLADTLYAEASL